jgi:molybdate transport system substrate-binding protein
VRLLVLTRFSLALQLWIGLLLVVGVAAPAQAQGSNPASASAPKIAAASDLKFALDEVVAAFRRDARAEVTPVYGSSGNFRTQIRQGAPFEIFMSADEGFVFQLADEGRTEGPGDLYAIGRIVLFAPNGSPLKTDTSLSDLKSALPEGRISRFAIANPEHAPYGRAAEEALRHRGLWDALKPRLVLGENVSQAAQFASSGSAQGGIVALSLALSPQVGKLGTYALIPAEWHRPLAQRMVLIKGASEVARRFYDYVRQPAARDIFRRYGFVLPGEAS